MATKRWQGDARAIADVWTFTPGGTIASGSTFTFTVAGKAVVYTSTGATAAIVSAGVTALWNSTDNPLPPEFREYEAVDGTGTVVFTHRTKGVSGTIACAAGGSGSPSVTMDHTVSATGPNFIDNAANWSDGAAPSNSDVLVYDSGSVDCLHGDISSLTGITIKVLDGYTGRIGLPEFNGSGSNSYPEYREKYIKIDGGTLEVDNAAATRVRVDFQSTLATLIVRNTGARQDAIPVVTVKGGASSSRADITRGDVGLAFFAGETVNFPTVNISYVDRQESDANVYIGPGTAGSPTTITTLTKSGGNLVNHAAVTTFRQLPGGGVTTQMAGGVTTATVDGGRLNYNSSGTLATGSVSGDGFLDFDGDTRAKTVTNPIDIYGGQARLRDSRGVVASLVVDCNAGSTAAQIDRGTTYRLTYGSVA